MQLPLFDSGGLTQDVLEATLTPLYPKLWAMIRGPFDDVVRRRTTDPSFRHRTEGQIAQWLRPEIVEYARRLFPQGNPEKITIREVKQQLRLEVEGQFAITPKKLRTKRWRFRDYLTFSSADTTQNVGYWRRQHVDGFDDSPRVIVGYQFLKEMTDIRIMVAYPCGKNLFHGICYLMPNQASDDIRLHQPEGMDDGTTKVDRGFKVTPIPGSQEAT